MQALILSYPDWENPFRRYVYAPQFAVEGKLTQLDENGKDRVIAFFSKKLSPTEHSCTANDRELLVLVRSLERHRCYIEGSTFEIITNNQVLKHYFSKSKLSRRETRWLKMLENSGVFSIT